MRDKSGAVILSLFVAALLAAAFVTVRFAGYPASPPADAALITALPASPPPSPQPLRIAAPRAVLALDVSGSMGVVSRPSDPDHLQTVAAVQFFDAFRQISQQFLGEGEAAGLAVVLYGTVAQTIDWQDAGGAFLDVTDANRDLYVATLERYLGRPGDWGGAPGEDPRRSQDSDYAAALDAVAELVGGSPSPPAVVFMTDGRMDAHPCYTPLLTDEQRSRIRVCSRREPVPPYLEARGGGPIFDRRAGERPINKTEMPETVDVAAGVRRRVAWLVAERFPLAEGEAPAAWFPIYLDTRSRWSEVAPVQSLLAGSEENRRYWLTSDPILHCRTGGAMVRGFVAALARWYRMTDIPIAPDAASFRVPDDTQAVIVQVESVRPLPSLRLECAGRTVELTGGGRYWQGFVADDCAGEWRLAPAGGLTVTVHAAPRYGWVLAAPDTCIAGSDGSSPEARLYLCRFTDGQAVDGRGVYPALPARLAGRVAPLGGDALPLEFELRSGDDDGSGPPPTYVAAVPVARIAEGPAFVSVRLDTLAALGLPVRDTEPTRRVAIEALTRLVVEDAAGRRLDGMRLENVPRTPGWAGGLAKETP